jgi:hypothetical protein
MDEICGHKMLYSYIAPAAPATRRQGRGDEPAFRPEIGFTPKWYRKRLDIDFGEIWHKDPAYRKESVMAMRDLLRNSFPGHPVGHLEDGPDLLTGVFGGCTLAGIFGIPVVFSRDNWPACAHEYIIAEDIKDLECPDLENNKFFVDLLRQLEWIEKNEGRIIGFVNWQGLINNAWRIMGDQLFTGMLMLPDTVMHLMDCICTTMLDAARMIHKRQEDSGVMYDFFTVSNCLVNMVSPEQYRKFIMPFDIRIAETFGSVGIHNCAWKADPYLADYAKVPVLRYIDMGEESDLLRARRLFPHTRRALMYAPTDFARRTMSRIQKDMERIAGQYAPCDIVLADLEEDVEDEKVKRFLKVCEEINKGLN